MGNDNLLAGASKAPVTILLPFVRPMTLTPVTGTGTGRGTDVGQKRLA